MSQYFNRKYFTVDDGKIWHLQYAHPVLCLILSDMALYCINNNKVLRATSVIRPHGDGISKSKTHQTARAFDVSIKGWDIFFINNFIDYFGEKYSEYAAVNYSGAKALIVHHDSGFGPHLHVQINSKYKSSIKYETLGAQ